MRARRLSSIFHGVEGIDPIVAIAAVREQVARVVSIVVVIGIVRIVGRRFGDHPVSSGGRRRFSNGLAVL
jgi:hypothetical protein